MLKRHMDGIHLTSESRPKRPKSLNADVPPSPKREKPRKVKKKHRHISLPKLPTIGRTKALFGVLVIVVLVITTLSFFKLKDGPLFGTKEFVDNSEFIADTLITDDTDLKVNFSFTLEIVINGQRQSIPKSYGTVDQGKLVINTNSGTGLINVQSPNKKDFFLHDFFIIWEAPFNSRCIFNHCATGGKQLKMTVNGASSTDFEKHHLKDGDVIRISL